MSLDIPFDNSYARLPDVFFTPTNPTPVDSPDFLFFNKSLAEELNLNAEDLESTGGLAVLSGNTVPHGAAPLAQVYAGHQFGNWVPQLGDGRAVLLGEVIDRFGVRRDIQLKGAGPTPYSRMGDGRAWLGPVLREYIVSEAMHALGVPTTRALAAVTTGERVQREALLPGAVLTRVAQSHIRVGTFQYFAARRDVDALKALTDHVIARHYPDANTPLDLLHAVIAKQAQLIAHWMSLGFIHGVMNTDNCQIAGETIDYGPCAFMDGFSPSKSFSAIDRHGRYAYDQQPQIGVWNLAQFATSLLPLMGEDTDAAIEMATKAVHTFPEHYQTAYLSLMRQKIGLTTSQSGDEVLIDQLLSLMAAQGADFTNTFRGLADGTARDQFKDPAGFDDWSASWTARLTQEPDSSDIATRLKRSNPAIIARNHQIEAAIQAALTGDTAPAKRLHAALAHPFSPDEGMKDLALAPAATEAVIQTFCGT
jgi:uncharacterized protein YdiU (UPF0061 family)